MQTLFMPNVVHVQNENQQLQLNSKPILCTQEAAMFLITTNAQGKGLYISIYIFIDIFNIYSFFPYYQNLEVAKCLGFLLCAFVQVGKKALHLPRSTGWDGERFSSIWEL